MSDKDRCGSGFFSGLLLGVLLGAAAGVLLAPRSGKETIDNLKKLRDDNEELIQDAVVNSEHLLRAAKDSIEDGFRKVSKMVEAK